jgi:hypothetical protein
LFLMVITFLFLSPESEGAGPEPERNKKYIHTLHTRAYIWVRKDSSNKIYEKRSQTDKLR